MELKLYLCINNLTNKEFARKIGINPNHLSNLIHKKWTPQLALAIRIHEATNSEVSYREMLKPIVTSEE